MFEWRDQSSQIVPSSWLFPETREDFLGSVTLDVLHDLADRHIVLRTNYSVKVIKVDGVTEECKIVPATVEFYVGQENPAKIVGHKEWHRPVDVGGHKVGVSGNIKFG